MPGPRSIAPGSVLEREVHAVDPERLGALRCLMACSRVEPGQDPGVALGQLAVAERLLPHDHGGRIRRPRDLRLVRDRRVRKCECI